MEQQQHNPELLDKIAKLIAVGQRGGTEAEMDTAMKMVHQLLAKYNLTMDEVKESQAPRGENPTRESIQGKVGQPWQAWIWNGVSKLYFCTMYSHRVGKKKIIYLIGKPSNVAVAKNVAQYVIDMGFRLSKSGIGKGNVLYQNSFKVGFGTRIYHRCEEEIARAKAGNIKDDSTGKALILHPLYSKAEKENEDHLAKLNIKLGNGRKSRTTVRSSLGYSAGEQAGSKVCLRSNGISGSAVGRLN